MAKHIEHLDPSPLPEIPRVRGPQEFTSIGSLLPALPSNACGASKPISGRRPLRCTRPSGHDGDHGVYSDRLPGVLLVRWSR